MRKTMTKTVFAAALVCFAALPAMAHETYVTLRRPYVVEKTCDDDNLDCSARMIYAPGQNPGLAGQGSYWYPRATRYVRVWNEDHVNWCSAHYKTYDPYSDTFVGKGYRHYRCHSPYGSI